MFVTCLVGCAFLIGGTFLSPPGILSPKPPYSITQSSATSRTERSGKMSQDQGPFTWNADSFNTTGSLNYNTNSLNNNNNCFNTHITVTDDRAEILTWLSPLEPRLRHSDLESRRVRDVGNWLLQTEEFRSWKSREYRGRSQKATIFCPGNPGVGKTYIR